jgi:hypothetical protein
MKSTFEKSISTLRVHDVLVKPAYTATCRRMNAA